MNDDLLDLLVDSLEMVLTPVQPLTLTVVFEFEHSFGHYLVHDVVRYVLDVLNSSFQRDVDQHSQKQQILVETQLILHVPNFREHLKHNQSQTSQIFPHLRLLNIEGQIIVLFEY